MGKASRSKKERRATDARFAGTPISDPTVVEYPPDRYARLLGLPAGGEFSVSMALGWERPDGSVLSLGAANGESVAAIESIQARLPEGPLPGMHRVVGAERIAGGAAVAWRWTPTTGTWEWWRPYAATPVVTDHPVRPEQVALVCAWKSELPSAELLDPKSAFVAWLISMVFLSVIDHRGSADYRPSDWPVKTVSELFGSANVSSLNRPSWWDDRPVIASFDEVEVTWADLWDWSVHDPMSQIVPATGPDDPWFQWAAGLRTPGYTSDRLAPLTSIRETRAMLSILTTRFGVPMTNPDIDRAGGYRSVEPGIGRSMSAHDVEWPVTLFGVPLTYPHYEQMRSWMEARFAGKADSPRTDSLAAARMFPDWSDVPPPWPPGFVNLTFVDLVGDAASSAGIWRSMSDAFDAQPDSVKMSTLLAETSVGTVVALGECRFHHMPAPTAVAVMGSELPPDEVTDWVRLPYPAVLIHFDTPLVLDDVLVGHVDPLEGGENTDFFDYSNAIPAMSDGVCGGWGTPLGELAVQGGGVAGMCLFAGDDGRLDDWVLWIIQTNSPVATPTGSQLWGVWGHLGHSTLAHVGTNLAAYVSWGDWTSPNERMGVPPADHQAWANTAGSTNAAAAVRDGATTEGMRVIDVRAPQAQTRARPDREDDTPKRRVRQHERRGHWTKVRVASRDDSGEIVGSVRGEFGGDWHYEARWIDTRLVGDPSRPASRSVVYRLPTPAPH